MFHQRTNWRTLAIAAAAFIATSTAVFALSIPSTAVFTPRVNTTQQTNYYRFSVNFNDPRISTGVKFARLPNNAFVSSVKCHVNTAFNAATTNVFTVGTTASLADFIGTADNGTTGVAEASAQFQNLTSAAGLGVNATSGGEVDLYAKYTQSGTAASAGKVTCVVEYIPDNDQ